MTRLSRADLKRLGITPDGRRVKQQAIEPMTRAVWDARREGEALIIVIPALPPSMNEWLRMHWAARKRQINALSGHLRILAAACQIPKYTECQVQIRYYFRTNRRRDADNYAGKLILDALRYADILTDDNADLIRLPEPQLDVDGMKWRTEVWITAKGA